MEEARREEDLREENSQKREGAYDESLKVNAKCPALELSHSKHRLPTTHMDITRWSILKSD